MPYPVALGLTILLELPLYAGLTAVLGWRVFGVRAGAYAFAVAINALTHPLLWWLAGPEGAGGWGRLIGLEVAVVLVEGTALGWAARKPRFGCTRGDASGRRSAVPVAWWLAATVALAANATSWGLGWLLVQTTGWWR